MSTSQSSWNTTFDRLGVWASVMCFVHCLATPVVLSLSAVYAHFLPSEEHTHRVLAVCITILGAWPLSWDIADTTKHRLSR
jgi:Mn2+/Fe2+ NRAMP family transporter